MTIAASDHHIDDALARRNAVILAIAQAVAGAMPTIVVALGGLVGHYLLGEDKSLATLPVSTQVLGTATAIYPAAFLMKYVGRKKGFISGAIFGIFGALVAWYSVMQASFAGFCLGTFMTGCAQAFVTQYRFAAADTASDRFRPKAISWVMAGGVLAGVIGPQVSILTKDLFEPILFAGAYLGQAGLASLVVVILLFLKVPDQVEEQTRQGGRPVLEIISQFRFITAVTCASLSYAMMAFVMTATPLAMIACNHSQEDATLGIQWHVLGMYAPSFFTGNLIQRFGKETIVTIGLLLLAACSIVALMGIDITHFWLALVLLGVGWNFGFIGATAIVTDCYRPEERAKIQATNDFIVFGLVSLASFSSGNVLNAYGWETLNMMMFPPVILCLVLLILQRAKAKDET